MNHSESLITVRSLHAEDTERLRAIAQRAFPPTQSGFVRVGKDHGLVGCVDGEVAAAAVLRVIKLPSGRRIGMVAWLLTDPDYQGLGLASRLVTDAVAQLKAAGCDTVLTDVEGHNTASANVFHSQGFERLSPGAQWQRFGVLDTVWLWVRTGLALDPGHFLWVYDAAKPSGRIGMQRGGSVVANTLWACIALFWGGWLLGSGMAWPNASQALAVLLAVLCLFSIREASMRLTAWYLGQPLVYRAWEGGWGITVGIALLFGNLFPLPGGLYPPGDGWKYRDGLPTLGPIALAGTLAVAATVAAALWLHSVVAQPSLAVWLSALLFVGKPLLLFDSVMVFAPFQAFNARRIFDYNRVLWGLVAILGLGLFVLRPL